MNAFVGCVALVALVVCVAVITALAVGAIRRGPRRGSGSLGTAMLEVQSLLEPQKRHVVKSERAEEEDRDESGE